MTTIIIRLIPDTERPKYNKVTLDIQGENATFQEVITALIAVTDDLITKNNEAQKILNEKDNIQLEQSSTTEE